MNEMVQKQAISQFPEYAPVERFEAALPLFHLPIVTKVVEHRDLSVIAWYVLRAIGLGVDTPQQLTALLGLRERDLAVPGAELMRASLISYGDVDSVGIRPLRLTELGQAAVREKKKQPVPRQKTIKLHYIPLTGRLQAPERGVLSNADMRRELIFILPYERGFPTLADLDLQEVREAHHNDVGHAQYDIIKLTDLKAVYTEYLLVQVLILQHIDLDETRFAVFQGLHYRSDLSDALRRLQQRGMSVGPAEALVSLVPRPLELTGLSKAVTRPVELVLAREHELNVLHHEVRRRQSLRSATQEERERKELEEQIAQLEAQIDLAKLERDDARRQAAEATSHKVDFISTLEHRPLLEEALRTANQEVIILSPWMNSRAVDRSLAILVRKAMLRGVHIRIGYGYKSGKVAEDERSQRNAQQVRRRLEEETKELPTGRLDIVDLGAIHEKVLICDRVFCVVGSFNWLSYKGEDDDGIRAELGTVLRDRDIVEQLAKWKLQQLAEPMSR